MMNAKRRNRSGRGGGVPQALACALVVLFLAGCDALDRLLEVELPSQVPAKVLNDPQQASLLLSGAIADFECAFGSYVANGGLLGNELVDATFTADRWPLDQRNLVPSDRRYSEYACEALGVYTPLSTARWSADNVLGKLEAWTDAQVPNRMRLIATAAAYAGYSYLLLGEGFCSCAIDLGPELSSQEMFTRAEAKFSRAIEAARAAGDNDILNMAYVGRARTRLNLGKKAEAAADARNVPTGFVKNATASTVNPRRRNRLAEGFRLRQISVGPDYWNLKVGRVADPRVDVEDKKVKGVDAATPMWAARKYPADDSPMPIATWREAKLIIAEAEGGQTAVAIINELRARYGLPAFSSASAAEIQAQVVEERRRELFLEGHHLYDLRRLNLPLSPPPGTPYPKGGVYGDQRCLPLPDIERRANPNLRG